MELFRRYVLILAILHLFFFTVCKSPVNNITREEIFLDSLISQMTIDEKIGQMTLFTSDWEITGPVLRQNYLEDIKSGRCGNIFNAHTVKYNTTLQKIAMEESRLKIPLLFGYDVIHGYSTIFPIPLAEACSWDLDLIRKTAALSAQEAAAAGLNWTFSPMVDICRDPRWGRIAEGAGEDPYLGSLIAAAKVKGYQGDEISDSLRIAACVKHFAAYGAPIAGRDYNTVDMSELELRQNYLPPYKSAIEAGAVTIMTSFNDIFGIPATANKYLLTDILRYEWGFKGFVVTDYTSINELVNHGVARDEKNAGEIALNAGVDMDMQGGVYFNFTKKSLEEGSITIDQINRAVKSILRVKYRLGLFADPYRHLNPEREIRIINSKPLMDHALEAAKKSIVLLKNENVSANPLLPIPKGKYHIAVIGPLADDQIDMLGSWHAAGVAGKVTSLVQGMKNEFPEAQIISSPGCDFSTTDKSGFKIALDLANKSDMVILALGENYQQNGEAASRSEIGLPGVQEDLANEILKTGKPVILVIMAGRPLIFPELLKKTPAILYTWHLGTRAGDAIAEVLSGDYNPSGKLVVSFPRNVGQIPIYYNSKNTGRPFNQDNKYTSKYLDVPNTPQFPFGFGLSYTSFAYSNLRLDKTVMNKHDTLRASVELKNTGKLPGEEVVQLYIRDIVAEITRPVKELKGFHKVKLEPGETKNIVFSLTEKDLRFYNSTMNFVSEPGKFRLFIGGNSDDVLETDFELED